MYYCSMEPFLLPLLPHLISMHADRSQVVRDSAAAIGSDLMQKASPFCFREKVFPAVTGGMTHEDWRVKVAALTFLRAIAPRVSKQMTPLLPGWLKKMQPMHFVVRRFPSFVHLNLQK